MIHRRSLLASSALASLAAIVPLHAMAQSSKKDAVTLALTLEPPVLEIGRASCRERV